jgi:hypothetical protein
MLGVDADATAADSGFEAVYVAEDGAEHRVSLAALAGVRLEAGRPVRSFPSTPSAAAPDLSSNPGL